MAGLREFVLRAGRRIGIRTNQEGFARNGTWRPGTFFFFCVQSDSGVIKKTMSKLICVFCKQNSSNSVSTEHIIPESLWNTKQLLRPGIVCDQCNNYFSREVEKPFLELPEILALRFEEGLPSKRKKIPPIKGILFPDAPVTLHQDIKKAPITVDVPTRFFDRLRNSGEIKLIIPTVTEPPVNTITTRFLAKVALEAMAQKFERDNKMLSDLIKDEQFDPLRNHARRGTTKVWEISIRRIYPSNKSVSNSDGQMVQVVHEYDFLPTKQGEVYFVLALFGIEFSINIGGPYMDGYRIWLKENNEISPLYFGKNKDFEFY